MRAEGAPEIFWGYTKGELKKCAPKARRKKMGVLSVYQDEIEWKMRAEGAPEKFWGKMSVIKGENAQKPTFRRFLKKIKTQIGIFSEIEIWKK